MKISVVIPVYDVEAYLRTTLDSVVAQSHTDWECICVDDGSTDGSGRILDEYAEKDSRIKVIHQANDGVSSARNRGTSEATGDLVAFLDADDVFYPFALKVIGDVWRQTGAEVIRYDWRVVRAHGSALPSEPGQFDFARLDFEKRTESPLRVATCGAFTVVASRIAHGISWPLMTQCEDPLYLLRCFAAAKSVVKINLPLADYLVRADSAAREANLKVIAATCQYLPLAYDACQDLVQTPAARADTVCFLKGFLEGPLKNCWKRLPVADREAARRAVLRAGWAMALRSPEFERPKERLAYDLIFCLGSACSATQTVRAGGLQHATLPFDWLYGGDLRLRTKLLVDGFKDWLEVSDLEQIENPDAFGHDSYVNRRTGIRYLHDFDKGRPLSETFACVKEKYDRRIARLLQLIGSSRHVLAVWIGDPRDEEVAEADVRECRRLLAERFSGVEFDLLVTDCLHSPVDPSVRKFAAGIGYERVGFDYKLHEPVEKDWPVDRERLVPLMSPYSVWDYRTAEERRAYRARQKRERYQRYQATSLWSYWVTSLQFRIFRHFKKTLERKGVKYF